MAALPGLRGQPSKDHFYDASGTIATGGTPQLVLPAQYFRSSMVIVNISSSNMFFEFGAARATATLTSGAVSAVTVTNAGFGYTRPPKVTFFGGFLNNTTSATYSLPCTADFPNPSLSLVSSTRPAQGHCVMTGTAGSQTVSSIVIDDPGLGYVMPPYVFLENDPTDPFGAAVPSATNGVLLVANGGAYTLNSSVCTADQVSVYCATTSAAYTCKYTI